MLLLFQDAPLFVGGFTHTLGSRRRRLDELAAEGMLRSSATALAKVGYEYNYGAAESETLSDLAAGPMRQLFEHMPGASAFIFNHTYAENGITPFDSAEIDPSSRARYTPAELLRLLGRDDISYFSTFGSGCSGLFPLLITGSGLVGSSAGTSVICLSADIRPPGTTYDASREQSLFSDAAAGFHVGRAPAQYELLGLSYYSTTRSVVLLIETVKRTVDMLKQLVAALRLDLTAQEVIIHYPNVFPKIWDMVTQYLKIPRVVHVLDGLAERAHCLSADSMITLAKMYQGNEPRLHVVVNMGAGIHLGVCILREQPAPGPKAP